MPEFEWPFDKSERVNDRARPKDANYAQSRAEIEERRPIVQRKPGSRVVGQEIERNPLNDAGKSELNVDNVGVEFAARKIHSMTIWRAWRDSNPQPSDPKSEALSS